MNITYRIASAEGEFEHGKGLFLKYAASLDVDLSFQNFNDELKTIHTQYNKPKGALLIAYNVRRAIGCVAIREFEYEIAELKRMFVLPEYQGLGIGRKMLDLIIDIAQQFHFKKLRLDTLPGMIHAQNLYRSYGFLEIPAYRFNPIEGTVFLEREL
jgi:putative acetyltransferase